MKITKLSTQKYTSFKSKKKNIRLADDIVRKTKHEFPAHSPSYIDSYWLSLKNPKHSNKERNVKILTNNLGTRLFAYRINCGFKKDTLQRPLGLLETTKEFKIANCIEFAQLTEATMLANGYRDTNLAEVKIKLTLFDKKSKKKIYECFELFDHIVVLSKLDDKNSKNPIILDAWIGKAMSFSKAKEEYLGMLSEEEIEKIVKNGLASYNLAHALNLDDNDTIDLNGIDYSIQIVFDELESSF